MTERHNPSPGPHQTLGARWRKGTVRQQQVGVTASDQDPGKVTPTSQLHVTARNTVHNVLSSKVLAEPALSEFLF